MLVTQEVEGYWSISTGSVEEWPIVPPGGKRNERDILVPKDGYEMISNTTYRSKNSGDEYEFWQGGGGCPAAAAECQVFITDKVLGDAIATSLRGGCVEVDYPTGNLSSAAWERKVRQRIEMLGGTTDDVNVGSGTRKIFCWKEEEWSLWVIQVD